MRSAAAVLTFLALLGTPAGALAQDNPLGPLPTPAPEPPSTVVVAPNNDDNDGLKGWQQALILASGLILLGGIAWAIVSDARNKAPVKDSELAHPGLGGPVKHNRSQKQRDR